MIGRTQPVKPFELIRWARACARTHRLQRLDAHVLLLLATYADDQAQAWPSIGRLARDCGMAVRTTSTGEKNSNISAALARLEDAGLVWRKQSGKGKSATTELLFDPDQPSCWQEGKDDSPNPVSAQTCPPAGRSMPSCQQEANGHRNGQNNSFNSNSTQRPVVALLHTGGQAERSNRGDRTRQPRPLAATLHDLTDQTDEPA